jgi:nucleoporin NUP82
MIAQLQNRLAAIRSASQAIEHRVDIQIREFQRQLELLKKSSATIKALKNDDTAERAEKMLEKQDKLAERMDRVVAALSADYRPEIGEVEKKWFDELEKLRTRIHGGGGFGLSRTRGLTSQVEQVSRDLPAEPTECQRCRKLTISAQRATGSGETICGSRWDVAGTAGSTSL